MFQYRWIKTPRDKYGKSVNAFLWERKVCGFNEIFQQHGGMTLWQVVRAASKVKILTYAGWLVDSSRYMQKMLHSSFCKSTSNLRWFTFLFKRRWYQCLLKLEHNLSNGISYRPVHTKTKPILDGLLTQRKLPLLNEKKDQSKAQRWTGQ